MNFDNDIENTNNDLESKTKSKYLLIFIGILIISGIVAVIIYLSANNKYSISLNGDNHMTIYVGDDYIDPGYTGYNKKNDDVTSDVVLDSQINTSVPGDYMVTYRLGKTTEIRYVTVTEKPIGATYMYLKGNLNIILNKNESYKEPGYIVIDTVDSNLSNQVKVTSNVNIKKAGTYKIVYSVVNSSGVTTSASRTVVVVDSNINLTLSPSTYTNGTVNINVNIEDKYFSYMILPNNTKVSKSSYTYRVSENGTYTFKSYNSIGGSKESTIKVSNIDKVLPTGSCSGTFKDGKSTINIVANDNIGISKYIINNNSYTSKQVIINSEMAKANIKIYDAAGNVTNISCNLEDKNGPGPDYFKYSQPMNGYIPGHSTYTYCHFSKKTVYIIHDVTTRGSREIYAPISGTITYAQNTCENSAYGKYLVVYGNKITIERSDGASVVMGHLESFVIDGKKAYGPIKYDCNAKPYPGDCDGCSNNIDVVVAVREVKTGDLVGYMGNTGNSAGPHLHLEFSTNGSECVKDPWKDYFNN